MAESPPHATGAAVPQAPGAAANDAASAPERRVVGARARRIEDPALLRGQGQFADDIDKATAGKLKITVHANASLFHIQWDDLQLNLPNPQVPAQFYIANVGGASGTVGAREAKGSAPDGYTLYAVHDYIHLTYYAGIADVKYTDFEPICLLAATPSVLTASPKTPWKDWKEFVADAKARAEGKVCDHPCCVEAVAAGKACAKCNPKSAETPAPVAELKFKDGGCCALAKVAGKTCDHPCCVEAAKAGAVCKKCNPDA